MFEKPKLQKDIDELKIEKKGLEETVGFLRTEFNSLQKTIGEEKLRLQGKELTLEQNIKIQEERIERAYKALNADQNSLEVEKARTQVLFGNAVIQKEKNAVSSVSLSGREKTLEAIQLKVDKYEKDYEGRKEELNKSQEKLNEERIAIEGEKMKLAEERKSFVTENEVLSKKQQSKFGKTSLKIKNWHLLKGKKI